MVILFYVIIIVVVLCICYHVMVKWTLCKTDSHSISDDWYIIMSLRHILNQQQSRESKSVYDDHDFNSEILNLPPKVYQRGITITLNI